MSEFTDKLDRFQQAATMENWKRAEDARTEIEQDYAALAAKLQAAEEERDRQHALLLAVRDWMTFAFQSCGSVARTQYDNLMPEVGAAIARLEKALAPAAGAGKEEQVQCVDCGGMVGISKVIWLDAEPHCNQCVPIDD